MWNGSIKDYDPSTESPCLIYWIPSITIDRPSHKNCYKWFHMEENIELIQYLPHI